MVFGLVEWTLWFSIDGRDGDVSKKTSVDWIVDPMSSPRVESLSPVVVVDLSVVTAGVLTVEEKFSVVEDSTFHTVVVKAFVDTVSEVEPTFSVMVVVSWTARVDVFDV